MSVVYNEHGVIVSQPEKVLATKNGRGSLRLDFYHDRSGWKFGFDIKCYSFGAASCAQKGGDTYETFREAKRAAYECGMRLTEGGHYKEHRRLFIKMFDEASQGKLWEEEIK